MLAKLNPATTNATILYTAPAGRKPQVNVNCASVVDAEASFTLGLVKSNDKSISAIVPATPGRYMGKPNVVITQTGDAPTTAAVATVSNMSVVQIALAASGSGYAQGQVLTLNSGGTGTQATITVDAIDVNGAITAATLTTGGNYTVLPTEVGQTAVTGGTGTNAKFAIQFGILSISVSNGGNGYDPARTTITTTNGELVAATFTTQYSVAFEPLTDTYHSLTRLNAHDIVERTGIVMDAGDLLVVKTEQANAINFTVLGYEDLA